MTMEIGGVDADAVGADQVCELLYRRHARSTMVAIPCPTPMHIVANP